MLDIKPIEDIDTLAATVWLLTGNEGAEGQAALSWLTRNRSAVAARRVDDYGCHHMRYGDGSLLAACQSVLEDVGVDVCVRGLSLNDKSYERVRYVVRLVCTGELPDQTKGATLFHRHDQAPCWSGRRRACALIGERLYYLEEELDKTTHNCYSPKFENNNFV